MEIDCGICRIRSWEYGDKENLPRHANNYKIWLNLRDHFPHPYSSADAERWLKYVKEIKPETNFAIDLGGEAVGGISLMLREDIERCSAEVGYWLAEEYWGQGIATAALRSLTEYAFKEFSLTRVYAVPFARNAASIKVLEKVGYNCEGVMRRSSIKNGEILDQLMYAITDQ